MTTLDLFTDACRWWGACAGFIGISDIGRILRLRWAASAVTYAYLPRYSILGMGMVYLFLMLAGTSLPLSYRLWGAGSMLQAQIMATAWPALSAGGWFFVISKAQNTRLMKITALAAFPSVLLAAIVSAPGGA